MVKVMMRIIITIQHGFDVNSSSSHFTLCGLYLLLKMYSKCRFTAGKTIKEYLTQIDG